MKIEVGDVFYRPITGKYFRVLKLKYEWDLGYTKLYGILVSFGKRTLEDALKTNMTELGPVDENYFKNCNKIQT